MRVLVVEDEPRVASVARRALERFGSTIDVAETAGEAIELLRHQTRTYHVVVIDRVLPDMSGDEVAAEVEISCPEAGVVLTSGRLKTDRPLYDVWLAKPYGPNELVRAVVGALAARSRRRYCSAPPATTAGRLST